VLATGPTPSGPGAARLVATGVAIAALVSAIGCASTLASVGTTDRPALGPTTALARGSSPTPLIGLAQRTTTSGHLFGVSVASVSQLPAMHALSQTLARRLDLVNVYAGWTAPFPIRAVQAVTAIGSEPEITWEPWDSRVGRTQNPFPLRSISGGAFDAYIRAWASAAVATGEPLLVRFGHEMNGTWYPWDVGINGNTPGDYVSAYRHVRAVFTAAGATNVSWVWSPNVLWRTGSSPDDAYPGADAVDFIGVDGYNAGTAAPGGTWSSPQAVFGVTLAALSQLPGSKPVLITETASSELGGDKAGWIHDLLGFLAAQRSVVGLVWSEYRGRADWPIETSPASLAAMTSSLATLWP
jgi:hypothetical protein